MFNARVANQAILAPRSCGRSPLIIGCIQAKQAPEIGKNTSAQPSLAQPARACTSDARPKARNRPPLSRYSNNSLIRPPIHLPAPTASQVTRA